MAHGWTIRPGPIIWGEPGTNGQHAFYQLIHQGTKLIPCDFFAPAQSQNPMGEHHVHPAFELPGPDRSSDEGKNRGRSASRASPALEHPASELESSWSAKTFPGQPANELDSVQKLTPETLGSLIALYEHKIFTQGVIWNINSFDQMGVELGKQLAKVVYPELKDDKTVTSHDASTNGLINYYKSIR